MRLPTARDMPLLRHDLSQWYASDDATELISSIIPTTLAEARTVKLGA